MNIDKEHDDQYKMLRDEIVSLVAETRGLEFKAVAATATLYAWLAVHSDSVPFASWFIGFPILLLAGFRSLSLFGRISFIAAYLRRIEANYFVEDPNLPGYENYFESNTSSRVAPTSIALWVSLLILSLAVPFLMRWSPPNPKVPAPIIQVIGAQAAPTDGTSSSNSK